MRKQTNLTVTQLLSRLPKVKHEEARARYQQYCERCKKLGAPVVSFRNYLIDLVGDPDFRAGI